MAAEIFYKIDNPYGAVLPKEMISKFDLMKRLASENLKAHQIRERQMELSLDFISWVNEDVKTKYTEQIASVTCPQSSEQFFYIIVYCVLERLGVKVKCGQRFRLISNDMFCKLINKNRKTLFHGGDGTYDIEKIKEIWRTDLPGKNNNWLHMRKIIIEIFDEIYSKLSKLD